MSRYIEAAVANELARLRGAVEGSRGAAAFRAGCSLGSLVGAGALSEQEIESRLVAAAMETGLPERKARSHVHRGLRIGALRPREIPIRGQARLPHQHLVPRPTPPRRYLPSGELRDLVQRSRPVTEDRECYAWIEKERGLDPHKIDLWRLARALPELPLPKWAAFGSSPWSETGHRLLIPLYDHSGKLRSLKARAVRPHENKELAPQGFPVSGLVMADIMGRRVLRGEAPDWWRPEFVVVEGGPDFLTWAHRQSDSTEGGPAVIGVFSGSWSDAIAAHFPTGSPVYLRGHTDASGASYMNTIVCSIAARCQVHRRPS